MILAVAILAAFAAAILAVAMSTHSAPLRARLYVRSRAGRIVATFARNPFSALCARALAALLSGSYSVARGTLPPSARCRIDGRRRYTRCAIIAARARSYVVELPNGDWIVRKRPLVILSSRYAAR